MDKHKTRRAKVGVLKCCRSMAVTLVFLTGCGESVQSQFEPTTTFSQIVLKAEDAGKQGSAEKKFGRWTVWCGHNICNGTFSWTFSGEDGSYNFIWKEVLHKCAGSPPYSLYIDGEKKRDGKVHQHGSCEACTGPNIVNNPDQTYWVLKDINLGRYEVKKGSLVQLWLQNAFDCGIQNPGAYGDFVEIVAQP